MSYDSYRYDSNDTYSDARWADENELKQRLVKIDMSDAHYPAAGLPLISDGRTAYVNGDDSHGLIIGSTGSKKSRLLAMPMMEMFARAGESVICTDPKGELYERTSGLYASEGYSIKVVNLRDPKHSHGWNPLYEAEQYAKLGEMDDAVSLITDLAMAFFPTSSRIVDPFWDNTSRTLFESLCEMLIEKTEAFPEISLRAVQKLSENMDMEEGYSYDGRRSCARELIKHYDPDSLARINLESVLCGSDKTTSNVVVSYKAGVQFLYSRKALQDMLSVNDIDFSRIGMEKTVVYIIMPDEKTTLHRLVSVLIKQCYERLIHTAQECEGKRLPVRVNFLLDEFSNLPTIPDMSSMISAARSRNIRFYLIIQSLNQLRSKYGEDAETIRGNCNDWVFLTSRETALLSELETLCGKDRDNRPLINISRLQRLDKEKGEALILCGRLHPFMGRLADIDSYPFSSMEPAPLPEIKAKPFDSKAMESTDTPEKLDDFDFDDLDLDDLDLDDPEDDPYHISQPTELEDIELASINDIETIDDSEQEAEQPEETSWQNHRELIEKLKAQQAFEKLFTNHSSTTATQNG